MMGRRVLILCWAFLGLPIGATTPTAVPPPPATVAHADKDDVPDSMGAITVRPVPETSSAVPTFLRQAEYLRKHKDNEMAATYLRSIVERTDLSPRDREQLILELADSLRATHHEAESLSWLKLWMQLYAGRPEMGAVGYRVGSLYTQMGLSSLARDAYYQSLSCTVNRGEVQNSTELDQYSRLTMATLWALADNEYQAEEWSRAAKLFERYHTEAIGASANSLEKAAFLQADCHYQLHQTDAAASAYELVLQQHPFNPLAPEARLHLYHLHLLQTKPALAQEDLEALIWSVRTAWPRDEAYWQERTAETLLALNQNNGTILPALLATSTQMPSQGKTWQKELDHYDRLVDLRSTAPAGTADASLSPSPRSPRQSSLPEDAELLAMQRSVDELTPVAAPLANP